MKTNATFFPPTCLVKGHSFIQHGDQWVEAEVEKVPQAPHVRIRYDSREFFQLLARYPKALPCVTVGRNVHLLLDGTVYEIHE